MNGINVVNPNKIHPETDENIQSIVFLGFLTSNCKYQIESTK
jgi:hypothetical protein